MSDPGLLRPVLELSPAYLDAAMEEAWRRYGSFGAFLTGGLGASETLLASLREALFALVPARFSTGAISSAGAISAGVPG
jgi:hypothetical protein